MQPGSRAGKVRRYALPFLAAALITTMILFKKGVISEKNLWYGLLLPAVLELMFIVLCLTNISKIIRRYKSLKREGWQSMDAWQKALEIVVSPRIARLAALEPRLYYALYLSYRRKPYSDSKLSFATRKDSYAFFVQVFIFLCFLEIVAVTVLLPHRWLVWKVLHLILGLWAIMFLWADYRAIGLYDHLVTPTGIMFRLGLRCRQEIPWEDIAVVRKTSQSSPGGSMSPRIAKDYPGLFYIGVGGVCNMEIILKAPRCFQGMINDFPSVTRLLLSLETPDDFITAIRTIQPDLCSYS